MSSGTGLKREWPLAVAIVTTALFLQFGKAWLADLSNAWWFLLMLVWLFSVILAAAFAVVHHAESLAIRLGEPLGTLVLTLSVIGIEVTMISAVMLTGDGKPALARDAMFGLVLPNFTETAVGPTLSTFHSVFLALMSIGIYCLFLVVQNWRHREYFTQPLLDQTTARHEADHGEVKSLTYHGVLLVSYLLPIVALSEEIALPIDHGIEVLHAPAALGGFLVAALILSPESLSATRAALANDLQRSINILLGSVLASIGLTIPAVLTIGLITHKTVILGLDAPNSVLLLLTLALSALTFTSNRTNVLSGAVHLLLFLAYVMLLFER
jgi:Ca2+:H+ antiporter